MTDLTQLDAHFAFGENWRSYAGLIDDARIRQATIDLERLLGGRLDGRSMLDIGCGSGLSALAALRLGAREVEGVDIDPDSVAAADGVLGRFAPGGPWRVSPCSVFELPPEWTGRFDVVHSWGVLHHTGDMWRAIEHAARAVAPGGQLALALYRRTRCCDLWRAEKRWYAKASPSAQRRARSVYVALFRLRCAVTGRDFAKEVAGYGGSRGMEFHHDVHDWMGGFPYESVEPAELVARLRAQGFEPESGPTRGTPIGLFGSGCDEFRFRRVGTS